MKEKDIYLIRHGQTSLNAEKRALGQSDIDLTSEGIEETRTLAEHLRELGVKPEKIYTSPLIRAAETAQILQSYLGGAVEVDEALREINYGRYEGTGRQTLKEIEYGYDTQKMLEGRGETVEQVEQRVVPFLKTVLENNASSILVITHAFTASVLSQLMMGVPRSFSYIQPLSTADYSHFRVEKGGENIVNVLTIQRNCLKGFLSI